MNILNGRSVQDARKQKLIEYIAKSPTVPTLAIIQVGDSSVSNAYIQQKKKFGESIGANVIHKKLEENISFEEIEKIIQSFNKDKKVHGIIVQLPLSNKLDTQQVIDTIFISKDVDGLTSQNVQNLIEDKFAFVPATSKGILTLLKAYKIEILNKKVVIIGRSSLVGQPTARLMEKEGAQVVVCHRGTEDVPSETRQADIIIVAAGHPNLLTEDYIREGQVIIDVGINALSGEHFDEEIPGKKYVGDVDFNAVSKKVAYISPVPGGVGPMTVLSLFENLIDAYKTV